MPKTTLLTGGAGYIGSHTTLALIQASQRVLVLDNLCNSCHESIVRLEQLTKTRVDFTEGDVRDAALLDDIFSRHDIGAVIHFAGLKSVSESVDEPLEYYANNVAGTVNLCQAMARAGVFKLVFSSSATVYGEPTQMPLKENMTTGKPLNPYGRSKLMIEELLTDLCVSDPRWSIALLRYFNPIGAHESGLIGEDPSGTPNNLVPYLTQVAIGRIPELVVFGSDYPTADGTGVRDYIHVVDLANGHLKALQALQSRGGINIWNLGTGISYSVLEIIRSFEGVTGVRIPYRIASRRAGDVAQCWADPGKAGRELGWRAQRDLAQMMADTWRWQSRNPQGYQTQLEILQTLVTPSHVTLPLLSSSLNKHAG